MIVADAYINLRVESFSDAQFEEWAKEIIDVGKSLSAVHFKEVEFHYYVEEGSIKSALKGAVLAVPVIWTTVATYPQLKEGLSEIISDAREFGDAFNGAVQNITGQDNVIYKRAISRDINRLIRITESVDKIIDYNLDATQQEQYQEEISNIIHNLTKFSKNKVNKNIASKLINVIPKNRIPELPKNIIDLKRLVRREEEPLEMVSDIKEPLERVADYAPKFGITVQEDRFLEASDRQKEKKRKRIFQGTFEV